MNLLTETALFLEKSTNDVNFSIDSCSDDVPSLSLPCNLQPSQTTTTTTADDNELEFNSGVINKKNTILLLPKGWEVLVKKHKTGLYKGKLDKYWISPNKQKFNSAKKVM